MSEMLDKVRKLLAKAENTNNEEEANTFFTKAQELMEKYAIDEAMIRASMSAEARRTPVMHTMTMPDGHRMVIKHHGNLLTNICYHNRVICYFRNDGTYKNYTLAGFEEDVRFCEMLYHSLILQMDQAMLQSFFKDEKSATDSLAKASFGSARMQDPSNLAAIKQINKRTFRPEFMAGYVLRINQRLEEAADIRGSERTSGMDLALRNTEDDIRSWLNQQGVQLKYDKRSLSTNPNPNHFARGAGMNAANSADLGGTKVGGSSRGQLGS